MRHTTLQLLDILLNLDIIDSVTPAPNFYDEPHFYNYVCLLKKIQNTKGKNITSIGTGFSVSSKKEALLKSLAESIERYCLYTYKDNANTLSKESNYAFFPLNNNKKISIKNWAEGIDLITNAPVYIPTQLIAIDSLQKNEDEIMESNSTGAAFSFDKNSAILRSIYEIIERDAFMSYYLTQTPPKKIKLSSIHHKTIHNIIQYIHRYRINIELFDITTNIGIPSFLTCIIDKSDIGPSLVLGLKSSLDEYDAILGSINEAIQLRPWIRYRHMKQKKSKNNYIRNIQDRTNYWYEKDKLTLLNWLFDQKSIQFTPPRRKYNKINELNRLLNILKTKRIRTYAINITNIIFPKNIFVYKVFMPDLQPLYLNESKKFIHKKRLHEFIEFKKKKTFKINPIPHPFL